MKRLFFFEDSELDKLYQKGVNPSKRHLRENGYYIMALFLYLVFNSFLKFLHFASMSSFSPEEAIPLLIKCVLYIILFGFYALVHKYLLFHLKDRFFADTFYFCLLVISLVLFVETERPFWKLEPEKSDFFFFGGNAFLIELTFMAGFFHWKVKLISVSAAGLYLLISLSAQQVYFILCNILFFIVLITFILLEERSKRINFLHLSENMRDLTKEKTMNSRITLINEKERSAISDKILDCIQEGVLVLDSDANIIKMNEPIIKIFKELNVDLNDLVIEMLAAKIVTFNQAPDFILNMVSPSEQHIPPKVKTQICNYKEKGEIALNFKKSKARTSHVFTHLDLGFGQKNERRKSRVLTFKAPKNENENNLTSKYCATSNQSQASSKNQGLNIQVRKAIEILRERAACYERIEGQLDLMTGDKIDDTFQLVCEIFLEKIFEANLSPIRELPKYKFHLNIATTSFKDELRFILILREKKPEIDMRHLSIQNENKSKTLSFVSHEMRTPLNCIVGMLTVLEEVIEQPLADKYVAPAIASGKHLMNLLNDLLDAAQIQAGKFKLVFVDFDLKSLLSDALYMINIQAKPRGLELVLEWDNNLSHFVKSDPNRIRQIIINLLGNALKFTQKGGIRIITEKNQRNNRLIHIKVIDTGLGIKEDNKRKLFTAFGKLDQDENEYLNSQGVGLGLLISNILAKNLGPTAATLANSETHLNIGLNLYSEPGKGTEFEFVIENKNETDLLDEGDVLIELSELNSRVKTEEAYFLELGKSLHNQIGRKRRSMRTQKWDSESELRKFSNNILVETDPMSSSLSNKSEKSKRTVTQSLHSKKVKNHHVSKSKEEIESGRSFYKITNDLDKKTLTNQTLLNDLVVSRGARCITRNLQDVANNEEKIQILSELNIEKLCSCPDLLICDDCEFNVSVLKAMLEIYNFRMDIAYNGEEALKKIGDLLENSNCCKVYKLIFMDIEMPIKDGYESSKEIFDFFRTKEMECPAIIATTGHNTNKENNQILEAGMSDVLVKPILKGVLVELIVQKLFNLEKYSPSMYPGKGLSRVSDKILEIN